MSDISKGDMITVTMKFLKKNFKKFICSKAKNMSNCNKCYNVTLCYNPDCNAVRRFDRIFKALSNLYFEIHYISLYRYVLHKFYEH